MQQTTNYSLLLPEGTDIVNPLTQVNPNFSTIDGAMFANKQSSIGTATEVVTGTVHAIVRSNTDSNVFRFTATGAWTAGDSMTVDGVGVTVHLSDGTTPATNSYIIGAEVLAMINGTLVTLAISTTPPAQGVTSFNSRTGAVVPTTSDYDGSMVDYDNTVSGLNATDVQGAIDELAAQTPTLPSWSLLSDTVGPSDITIPAAATDVFISVVYGSLSFTNYFIPAYDGSAIRMGYYTSASNYANTTLTWDSVNKKLRLTSATFVAQDFTSTANVKVYIK